MRLLSAILFVYAHSVLLVHSAAEENAIKLSIPSGSADASKTAKPEKHLHAYKSKRVKHRAVIYFVRHGDTIWTESKLIQSHADIPLNQKGIVQALSLARRLSLVHFDEAYCSPLSRARTTLDAIIKKQDHKVPIHVDDRLISQGMGILTSRPYSAIDFNDYKTMEVYAGVEPRQHFVERLRELLGQVIGRLAAEAQRHPEGYNVNILIVGHGATFVPMVRQLRKAGGDKDAILDFELPAFFQVGEVPIVTIDNLDQIPLKDGQVDWQTATRKRISVATLVDRYHFDPKLFAKL